MERDAEIRQRILEAVAQEEEEMAKIFGILRDKLQKTRDWLPDDLHGQSVCKKVEMAVCVEKTIAEEIRALADKERAIALKVKSIEHSCHSGSHDCHRQDCKMYCVCEKKDHACCPFIKFCS